MRRQRRVPFFYGWVLVAIGFLTMAVGISAPDEVFDQNWRIAGCGGLGAGRGEPCRSTGPDRARPSLGSDWAGMGIGDRQQGFILCCAVLILLRGSPLPLLLYLMVIVQGSLGYGLTSVLGAIPAEIFEGQNFGSIFGTMMLAAILGGAAGPWVTGVIYDRFGTYLPALALSTVLNLVSSWRHHAR